MAQTGSSLRNSFPMGWIADSPSSLRSSFQKLGINPSVLREEPGWFSTEEGMTWERHEERHRHFHMTQLCQRHLVPVREVGLLRARRRRRSDRLTGDDVCHRSHQLPWAAKGQQVRVAGGCSVGTSHMCKWSEESCPRLWRVSQSALHSCNRTRAPVLWDTSTAGR